MKSSILDNEIARIEEKLAKMAGEVTDMLSKSVKGLVDRKRELLTEVFDREPMIDEMEINNEKDIINVLARFQPKATDLRTLTMMLFINRDLERIGDHAEDIAESALRYLEYTPVKPLIDIPKMAQIASGMFNDVLKAFMDRDSELAIDVIKRDDDVDALRLQVIWELTAFMVSEPKTIRPAVLLINIAQHIERIGDLSTNLAEGVIYMAEGRIIKHQELRERILT